MVRCKRCGLWAWINILAMLHEALKCYHGGRMVSHDWRDTNGKRWRESAPSES